MMFSLRTSYVYLDACGCSTLAGEMVKARYPKGRQEEMRRVFESVVRSLLSAILGIIVSSLLNWIHPVFGGIAILVTVVMTFIFIFQEASQASDEILGKTTR
jgi:hypothetical protein